MKKIIEPGIIAILTFFGIGFIPYFSGLFSIVIASLIFQLLNTEHELIIIGLTIILIGLFIPSNIISIKKINLGRENKVTTKVIGLWITLSSPVIIFSIPWILVSIFVFTVFSYSSTGFDKYLERKMKNWSDLIKDLTAGVAAGIVLHILYSGWLISPYVLAYLWK
ncbi:MAG: hypothetical protein HZB41_04415 [Ignavibacteriae bacterium]|nr:hypothetical protein [Ignavibacteriota bacterium]